MIERLTSSVDAAHQVGYAQASGAEVVAVQAEAGKPDGAAATGPREEYAAFRSTVESSSKAIGEEAQAVSRSLLSGDKTLGIKGLSRLVAYIAAKVESLFHSATERLTHGMVRNAPLAKSLERQAEALGELRVATAALDRIHRDSVGGAGAPSAGDLAAIGRALDVVEGSVAKFGASLSEFDADTEQRAERLRGLVDLVPLVYDSINTHRAWIDAQAGGGSDPAVPLGAKLENFDQGGVAPAVHAALEGAAKDLSSDRAKAGAVDGRAPKRKEGSKKASIPVNAKFQTSKAHHNEITTGRVKGDNPLFYRERQDAKLCLKHSVNAFLGGPFFSVEDMMAEDRTLRMNAQLSDIDRMGMERYAKIHGLDLAEVGKDREAAAGKAIDNMAKVLEDFDSRRISSTGGLLEFGQNFINRNREQLGVPPTELKQFTLAAKKDDILEYVKSRQDEVDRFVVGFGSHYRAFRRSENGEWFRVDSMDARQRRESPLEFMEQRISIEDKHGYRSINGMNYAEFMTFEGAGDVNPKFPGAEDARLRPADYIVA